MAAPSTFPRVISFGPKSHTLAFGALNGAAVALLLMRTRLNRTANRLLAALLAVVVLRLVPFILGYAGFYDTYPWLSFAPFDLPLAIGPLLWLYVSRLTRGAMPNRWAWHLAPAALNGGAYGAVFVLCTLPQKNWIAQRIVDPFVSPAVTGGALIGLAAYGWLALQSLREYQRWLDSELSNREEFRLAGLQRLLALMAGTGVVWLGFAVTDAFVRRLSYFDQFPFYVVQAGVAWVLGLLAWRDADTVYPIPSSAAVKAVADYSAPSSTAIDEQSGSKSRLAPSDASAQSGQDFRALGQQYSATIVAEGWSRDPQLSLPELARRLATNTSYLSRALNQGLGMSFNECINRMRVEAVAAELRAGSTRDLVQIGFDAGFNSKASFQRAFRLYMNTTPSAYREAHTPNRSTDRS